MPEHVVARVVDILREDSNSAAKNLAELLKKRQTELEALCKDDVSRLQEIINLYKNPKTRNLSELLINKANGLAHLCEGNDFFGTIINLAADKSPIVKSLGELLLNNSFGLVFLHKQIGDDAIPNIVELYSDPRTRDLSTLIMNRALDLATLSMEDKELFGDVVKHAANPETMLVLQSSLDANAKIIEINEPLYKSQSEMPPEPRAAKNAFIDSLSDSMKLPKAVESTQLDPANSFVDRVTAMPSQGHSASAA